MKEDFIGQQAIPGALLSDQPQHGSGIPLNYKRILTRALHNWYWIVLSIFTCLVVAYLFNRYSSRVYTVNASIIVREEDENAGAKFLYNNSLVNPYRNFFNELYIMRSYPLIQEVVEQLNFTVSWHREGNIKTTEVYDPEFPIKISPRKGNSLPYGMTMGFTIESQEAFSLEYLSDDAVTKGKTFSDLHFNDTVSINGYRLLVRRQGILSPEMVGKYYVIRFTDPFSLAKSYSSRLSVTWAEQGASVINLSISGPMPEKEIEFLNEFIARYQQYDIDKKNQIALKSIEFLDKQLNEMGDSLRYYENRMENFRRGNFRSGEEGVGLYEKVEVFETQKIHLLLMNNYYDYLEDYISKSNNFDQIVPPTALGINDDVVSGLIRQLTNLQFSIRMLGDQNNDLNPLVQDKKKGIQQLKLDILEGIKSIRASQKINQDLLDRQILEAKQSLSQLPEAERILIDIKRNYSIRENLFLFLMQKRAEAGISRASTTSDIVVVNPPVRSGGAITPRPLQNFGIAMALGLLLPFLVFLIAELANNRIQAREDIEQVTNIPVIGGIGHNAVVEGNMIVYNKPKSSLAESFRALRSNLNYFTQAKDKKIIMVTSSVSGEGKTFTTINLATVMAFAGKRVLIIGADMRRPRIFSDFNLRNDIGLSSYLSSMASLEEIIQSSSIENLDLISGGPVPPNPSELLMLPKVKIMMETLLHQYDYVILDTPPLGLVTDAFSLMPYADHTIFVVRQNHTPRNYLRNIQEHFDKRDVKNISILFNDIRKSGPGYGYGYGYSYGYGYGYYYGYRTKGQGNSEYYSD